MKTPAYVGVSLKGLMFSAIRFEDAEQINTELIDSLHDIGMTLKAISEEDYKNIGNTPEISLQELIELLQK
jgi:hypothetical protein